MRRVLCVLAIASLVALSASAVVPPQDHTIQKSRPAWVQAPELGVGPSLDRVERGNPRADRFPGVGKFFGKYSRNWKCPFPLGTRQPGS